MVPKSTPAASESRRGQVAPGDERFLRDILQSRRRSSPAARREADRPRVCDLRTVAPARHRAEGPWSDRPRAPKHSACVASRRRTTWFRNGRYENDTIRGRVVVVSRSMRNTFLTALRDQTVAR
jgi:hypothetical protein